MATYDYSNGKIYTIRSHQTNKYYIGSTRMKTLAQRLGKHRSNYKDYLKDNTNGYISSYEILKYEDHYIELLEYYPCNSKELLFKREGELQRQFKSEIVNIQLCGRTDDEIKANYKIYFESHKEEIKANCKLYYESHKEEINVYAKLYRETNNDEIKTKSKVYRDLHKEKQKVYIKIYAASNKELISQRKKQPFTCQCGANIRTDNQRRHNKTKRHLNYIQQQTITQAQQLLLNPKLII